MDVFFIVVQFVKKDNLVGLKKEKKWMKLEQKN